MELSNICKLINNINYIIDGNNKIQYNKIDCIKLVSKYSNTNIPIYKLKIDDKVISKNNSFTVSYNCILCNRENIVSLNNVTKKINKNIIMCRICKELDAEKQQNQSNFMIKNNPQFGSYKKMEKQPKTVLEIISDSESEFNNMSSDFIDDYYINHLTVDEFDYIKSKIISIQNGKFKDIDNFKYCPVVKCNNQARHIPMLYDIKRDVLEKIQYVTFKCEKCQNEFCNRDLEIQKNKIKIYCKNCTFCNNTFKIRAAKNCINDTITYQSKLELKFINFCNDNKIIIENGPAINYEWNNKNRKYIVDFYIPKLKMLIELKDDHIWHKQQIDNGMWKAKMDKVDELIKNNSYSEYLLIFPKNYVEKIKYILDKI